MGISGPAHAHLADGSDVGEAFVMLHREPWLPLDPAAPEPTYDPWWGYVRFDTLNGAHRARLEASEPMVFGPPQTGPPRGWASEPIVVVVISAMHGAGGFEALVNEHVADQEGEGDP